MNHHHKCPTCNRKWGHTDCALEFDAIGSDPCVECISGGIEYVSESQTDETFYCGEDEFDKFVRRTRTKNGITN